MPVLNVKRVMFGAVQPYLRLASEIGAKVHLWRREPTRLPLRSSLRQSPSGGLEGKSGVDVSASVGGGSAPDPRAPDPGEPDPRALDPREPDPQEFARLEPDPREPDVGIGSPEKEVPAASLRLGRDFRSLILAWAASLSGDGLRVVALPLLALLTNSSPVAVAAVAAASSAPWLLIAIPAGAIVDRVSPNRVITMAHLIRGLLTVLLVITIAADAVTIVVLCCFGFAITAAETFADGAAQSLLIEVVPGTHLERANARFVTVETLALDLAGPLAAGVLFLVAPWLPFAVSAGAFLLAALLIGRVRHVPAAHRPDEDGFDVRARMRDLRDGMVFLFTHPVLRTLVLTVAVLAVANAAADGVLVLYAVTSLGLDGALFPTLLAAYSVGTLVAAASVSRLAARFPDGPLMTAAMVGMGFAMVMMGVFATPIVGWIGYAALGLFGGTWNVLSATRRQRHTPRAIIGRVSSAFRVVAWGVIPIGATAGGAIAEKLNVPIVFTLSGALTLTLAALVGPILIKQRQVPGQGSR